MTDKQPAENDVQERIAELRAMPSVVDNRRDRTGAAAGLAAEDFDATWLTTLADKHAKNACRALITNQGMSSNNIAVVKASLYEFMFEVLQSMRD